MGDEMTQEDIDRLLAEMAGGGPGDSDGSAAEAQSNELSQAEIDAMLSGPSSSGSGQASPKKKAPQPEMAAFSPQAAKKSDKQSSAQSMQFSSFNGASALAGSNDIGMILDVPMELTVELGRTNMYIRDILDLGPGSVIEINRLAGEPIELLVNGKVIAKGEVVVIDEKFGLRITELLNPSNEGNRNN